VDQKQGTFIAIEGIDGAGTTTQAALLAAKVKESGRTVFSTSEPTDSPVGRLLRQVLAGVYTMSAETIAHLFAADRHEHLFAQHGIMARRARGEVVICDRYKYSSLAYQSVSADPELVRLLNDRFPDPDILLYVDLPPDEGDKRLADRSSREIYEKLEFQRLVSENYQRELLRASDLTGVIVVDGTLTQQIIAGKLYDSLKEASIL
jgi:dTMP kinase